MDLYKKRKVVDETATAISASSVNGSAAATALPPPTLLTPDDARKILEPLSHDHILDILESAVLLHPDVLDSVRSLADVDLSQRKLFIRGLGWDTTTEKLRNLFSSYGVLDEAVVILDKATGKSKGFGFITFKHIDGAILALKEPSKKIDGRMTVTQLAAAGASSNVAANGNASKSSVGGGDVSLRKIYVGSVPQDMPSDRLLGHFVSYGEIAEGPLGFDKQTGKSRGFAFFVYKTEEGARSALVDPIKNVDGHQVVCKLAVDGKKGKPGAPSDDRAGMPPMLPPPTSLNSQYGVPQFGGGYPGSYQGSSLSSLGGSGGYSGYGNLQYSGGIGSSEYGGLSSGEYGGLSSGEYGGMSDTGSSLYSLPPSSMAMPSGVYPETGYNGLSSSFPAPHNQPSSIPRGVPPGGGMYLGMPPYY